MRISAGTLKGRKVGAGKVLKRVDRGEIRPTSTKVREALFDILRNDISGSSFLDLYAGTGAVGFEALSRGASRVCFVESVRTVAEQIQSHIGQMELAGKAAVYAEEAERFLRRAGNTDTGFDIIFADPPYASKEADVILELLDAGGVLKDGGCLVVEAPSRNNPREGLRSLRLIKKYRYGDTSLFLYGKER
ncbi:MAG: 16S rRNA (guanine(966)-N(2))-methyltransferase RsmD [Nitrospiraceae bacterium]|nr:16S rRNA (guanine(966)-N(2))-methyltransferase RsmD [Nitrospiraceae bacterium]